MSAGTEHRARLLEFLAPGLLHQLRNALFAIQGQAQLLESGATRQRGEILDGVKRAQAALHVLRYLTEEAGPMQPGILLPRLLDVLRLPMRERGLSLSLQHTSKETPVRVDARLLADTVVSALRAIAARIPTGFRGGVHIDLCAQSPTSVEVTIELVPDRAQLPFQVDLQSVQQELHAALSADGGLILLVDRKLALHLPAMAAAESPSPQPGSQEGLLGAGEEG